MGTKKKTPRKTPAKVKAKTSRKKPGTKPQPQTKYKATDKTRLTRKPKKVVKKKAKRKAKPKKDAGVMGRPTDYQDFYPLQVRHFLLLNSSALDSDIANYFEVCEKTINNWKIEHPDFLQSIREGKTTADMSIANSLFNRANGMTLLKKVPFKLKTTHYSDTGKKIKEEERVEIVEVPEEIAPDVSAQKHWLNNRSDNWNQKKENPLGDKVPFVGMTVTPPEGAVK
uniref:Terminase small subunit n=1 Tax=uncultured marine virus TaxID=186617 RepID=A0A0F7L8N4_9VIRU|nr:hypothetical protein MICA_564 [uncultured marine virus]